MKILHFIGEFAQPTQTFIKRYVQKSMQFGEVAIVSFEYFNVPAEIEEKVPLYKINWPETSRKNFKGLKLYLYEKITGEIFWYSQLNDAIKSFKPDVIHCHFGNLGVLMMEFNKKYHTQIPYVTTIYAYDITSLPLADKKYGKNLKELWNKGDAFFAEGPSLANKFIAYGCPKEKCLINPLLIPIAEYPLKTLFRSINDPIKFLFIGRFVEKKGFHIFLTALGQLKEQINDFTIDIIGDGPEREVYNKVIADYKLESRIKWLGMVEHTEIIPMLKNYDFLAHSSMTAKNGDSEGGSATIIIEAEAVGLPVITTNHDDIPFVMGYKDFLAEENDVDSLKKVIIKILPIENIKSYVDRGIEKVKELHDLNNNKSYELNLKKIAGKN